VNFLHAKRELLETLDPVKKALTNSGEIDIIMSNPDKNAKVTRSKKNG